MADLTPPPSQGNTPHRPAAVEGIPSDAPLSPTARGPSNLSLGTGDLSASTSTIGELAPPIDDREMIEISSDDEEDSEEDEELDVEERMIVEGEGEGEEGAVPMEEIEGDEPIEPVEGEIPAEGAEGTAVEGVAEGGAKVPGAKRRARAPRGGAKTKGKGKAPAAAGGRATRGAASGGGSSTKTKKDGELYESEIVSRWNHEFGDVCRPRPPQKA